MYETKQAENSSDRTYVTLCAAFAILITTGNLIYQKFVVLPLLPFHTFELSVGAILYPFTFMISDLVTEFYGRERAKFCITLGITLNIFMALIIFTMDHVPATEWSTISNETFHLVFGHTATASLMSVVAAYISQRFDITVYQFVRRVTGIPVLANFSAMSTALLLDSCIVIGLLNAFGLIPSGQALWIIFNGYLFKLCLSVVNVPLFYWATQVVRAVSGNIHERKSL